MTQLGYRFEVLVASVEEHEEPDTDPRVMVAHNAALKADWVARLRPEALVLGADTTVFLEGRALNKPRDLEEARCMLQLLSGRTHTVFTGLALRCLAEKVEVDEGVATQVRFRAYKADTVEAYLGLAQVLDKAGAYGIQEHGHLLVESYEGSYTNIVGLPVEATDRLLRTLGLERELLR